jgi:hypothetical protein
MRIGVLAMAAFLIAAGPAWGQTQPNPQDEIPNKVLGPDGEEITDAECKRLEGATAPIQRIARLEGAMSVRNLEMTYFGKALHGLTAEDFALLRILKPFCDGTPSEIDKVIFDRLEQKVNEARNTRDKAVTWINDATKKLDAMEPSPEAIREVHNTWAEMENRRLEMLASDQRYFADYLTERRNELYAGEQARPRVLISPFDPGPTIPPEQKE